MDEQINPQPTKNILESKNFWTIFIVIIATALIVGNSVYFWQRSVFKSELNNLNKSLQPVDNYIQVQDNDKQEDNIVYYLQNENCFGLLLNGKLQNIYPKQEQICETIERTTDKPLLKIPATSHIAGHILNNENGMIITINNNTGVGTKNDRNYWYTDNSLSNFIIVKVVDNKIDKLFNSLNYYQDDFNYSLLPQVPQLMSISLDNNYLSFNIDDNDCYAMVGCQPMTFIYDISNKNGKNIGKVYNFEWLTNGRYRYKQYLQIECQPCTEGCHPAVCSKDPKTLPWVEASFTE